MKHCIDCISFDSCDTCRVGSNPGELCFNFKDSSKFVQLPCSLGDTAYVINIGDFWSDYKPYVFAGPVDKFECEDYGDRVWCAFVDKKPYPFFNLGKTWFLDRAAAEERLEKIIHGN